MFKGVKLILGAAFLSLCASMHSYADQKNDSRNGEIWFIEEDVVKNGKQELFETEKKSKLQDFAQFSMGKSQVPVFAIQDGNKYFFASPVKDFAGLDRFFKVHADFESSMSPEQWTNKMKILASTLNFRMFSIHNYVSDCSYALSPPEITASEAAYMHYSIYALEAGSASLFEQHLKKLSLAQQKQKTGNYWHVWKIWIGSDIPKYIICIFGNTQQEVEDRFKKLEWMSPENKGNVRKQRNGVRKMRPDLSLTFGQK